MQYYDRKSGTVEEAQEFQQGSLHFLYDTVFGRILLKCAVARPWLSKLYGLYQKSGLSKKDIKPFIEKNNIDVSAWDVNSFRCFNDFFTRKKDIGADLSDPNALLSIADSKIRIFPITEDLVLNVKRSRYTVGEILGDEALAEDFRGGTCIVFRLSVDDYHRYQYIDKGVALSHKKIKGMLHTVRAISEKYNVFSRNAREVHILNTESLGKVAQIEVGALFVGKIVNHPVASFEKMQEKGYFEYGGSTVVVLLNKEIQFDPDIAEMNAKDIEIKVHAGERIGTICV
ncbi:MAG: phosphatidylserine decarboxylase [Clostridia bacterium]|nr:phosphatidylserine decarboxylase [Clostridia bacterium]MBQ4323069.1 phosphatidylserine decarboxylase [Clostridia bacterium]